MDAWEILENNSTLENGDAWEHLNNQSGEGGGGTVFLLGPAVAECNKMAEATALCSATEAVTVGRAVAEAINETRVAVAVEATEAVGG